MVCFALAIAGALLCLISWDRYRDEQAFVAGLADKVLLDAGSPADRGVEIRNLYHFMIDTVTLDKASARERPFLRDSAAATLKKNAGLCGERARALIALLRSRDITARRVVLYGKNKGHVLVEVDYLGRPVIVDVFRRPSLQGSFLSLSIQDYLAIPGLGDRWSSHSYFNWRRFRRLPGIGRLLPAYRNRPLPAPLSWVLENPRLIEASASAALALFFILLGGALFGASRMRKSRSPLDKESRKCA